LLAFQALTRFAASVHLAAALAIAWTRAKLLYRSSEAAEPVGNPEVLVPRRSDFDGLRRRASRPWREARRELGGSQVTDERQSQGREEQASGHQNHCGEVLAPRGSCRSRSSLRSHSWDADFDRSRDPRWGSFHLPPGGPSAGFGGTDANRYTRAHGRRARGSRRDPQPPGAVHGLGQSPGGGHEDLQRERPPGGAQAQATAVSPRRSGTRVVSGPLGRVQAEPDLVRGPRADSVSSRGRQADRRGVLAS